MFQFEQISKSSLTL